MKQYILTCVNEEKEVVSTQAFATLGEAQEQMKTEYDRHVNEFGDDDDMIEAYSIGSHAANVYYSQEDYEYHWEISTIDMPDAPFTQMARNLFFIFRDDFENSTDARRMALFKAVFGDEMGEHIYESKWRNDRLYDFICSLDGTNIKKFADFLLDYHKYRKMAEEIMNQNKQ